MDKYDSFESAFDNLNNIVKRFEDIDKISIDDLLLNYEEGMDAYQYCIKKLEDTQKKIKIIDSKYE